MFRNKKEKNIHLLFWTMLYTDYSSPIKYFDLNCIFPKQNKDNKERKWRANMWRKLLLKKKMTMSLTIKADIMGVSGLRARPPRGRSLCAHKTEYSGLLSWLSIRLLDWTKVDKKASSSFVDCDYEIKISNKWELMLLIW